MKIMKTAFGRKIKICRSEWEEIGREYGWISKTAQNITYYSDKISEVVKDIQEAVRTINRLQETIIKLEGQIIQRAKNLPDISEGMDYYGSDYLSQVLKPEVKMNVSNAIDEGNPFDIESALIKYVSELQSVLRRMEHEANQNSFR